jgi:FkbM family methyltransferase
MSDMSASSEHLQEIERLLSEPLEAAAVRERETFGQLLRSTDGSVVLFGAGRLGKLCARGLRRAGVPLRAFCDRNPATHGTMQDGVDVLSPEEAARRFGDRALFVVAIWTGTAKESMVERVAWLGGLGCRQVATYAPLVWAHAGAETPFHSFDLPTRVLARAGELRRLARLLIDSESLRVLVAALRQRLHGQFDDHPPALDQYFPSDLLQLTPWEVVVDGGAFDGDTLEAFFKAARGEFAEYHAFEPDPANVERLRACVAALPEAVRNRVCVHPVALHAEATELAFSSHGAPTSHAATEGTVKVPARALDDALVSSRPVTFLKLDVEGAERAALAGAQRLIAKHRPSAAVCVYHGPNDLWELPLQLHEALPEHRLHLRQHGFDGWETVCYLLAPERAARPANVAPRMRLGEPRPCPVCESTGAREVLYRQRFFEGPLGDGYDVVVCENCGAGFADGIPTQAELDRYYAERSKYTYAQAGGAESPYDFKRFETIADQLEPHLPSKDARILDIGCATGGLLSVLRKRGYRNVLGSDPSPACAEAARKLYGIEVRTAALSEHAAWREPFDAVLLVGVLEHVREVRTAIRTAAGLLREGGVLYCAQPDVEAFADCVNAPFQQFSTEHVNFFSGDSLTRAITGLGLVPRQTWQWLVEWREGITDSVVSIAVSRPGVSPAPSEVGRSSAPALRRYITKSCAEEVPLRAAIEELVEKRQPILVWGTGTLTRHLLATTRLGEAMIAAFVDGAPLRPQHLAGRCVIAPDEIADRPEPIVIISQAFAREITAAIRNKHGLANRVLLLADGAIRDR